MATSEVAIANMALSLLGVRATIESFTENTNEANQTQLWYDISRKQVLEDYDWNFARKRLTLATHSEDPPDGVWEYRYQYPANCIKFRKINNPSGLDVDAVPFDVEMDALGESRSVLTDLEDAIGVYTFDQDNPDMFSPYFIEVLAIKLASHVAMPLTGKLVARNNMLELYNLTMPHGAALNANERVGGPPRDSDIIRGRV